MTLTFRIQIKNIKKPPVWRRLEIPGNYTFHQFTPPFSWPSDGNSNISTSLWNMPMKAVGQSVRNPKKKQIPTNEELEDIKSYFNFGIE